MVTSTYQNGNTFIPEWQHNSLIKTNYMLTGVILIGYINCFAVIYVECNQRLNSHSVLRLMHMYNWNKPTYIWYCDY